MARRIWELSAEELSDMLARFLRNTNPATQARFIELAKDIITKWENEHGQND